MTSSTLQVWDAAQVFLEKHFFLDVFAGNQSFDGDARRQEGTNIGWPSPVGLGLGILFVAIFQIIGVVYYYLRQVRWGPVQSIQIRAPKVNFYEDVITHATRLEAFVMLVSYLSFTWMFRIMPPSYYDLQAPINWLTVFMQLASVDWWTYVIHRIEHHFKWIYVHSHKSHHRFVIPKMLNAFTGSLADTSLLILIPLIVTTRCVPWAHCWDYIAFGTIYSFDFLIIHCEFRNPWDPLFEVLGVGTASHHNVHHAILNKNYGHLFMWWDMIFGTYIEPCKVHQMRASHIRVKNTE
eukprot:gb/GEZN01012471.1/.p1 GENE.gb/GEZN01012471.1/~~gb/GEZN01012471.1/.p1  ORF type:complete len:294 (+),score=26.33 gb/GEZN01012471.1/:135-1016(+)